MRAFLVIGFVTALVGCKERPDFSERARVARPTRVQKAKVDVEAAQQKEEKRDDKIVEQAK